MGFGGLFGGGGGGGGITGQASMSTTYNTTTSDTQGANSVRGNNSANTTDARTAGGDNSANVSVAGNLTIQDNGTKGVIDTAGILSGQALNLVSHVVDTALGRSDRTLDTAMAGRGPSGDVGRPSSSRNAETSGISAIFSKYGAWIIGGSVAFVGLIVVVASMKRRK